jgi:hypothetical protein
VALAPLADARALGGIVTYGKPYPVGERGPRLFVPGMSGRIHARLLVRFEARWNDTRYGKGLKGAE